MERTGASCGTGWTSRASGDTARVEGEGLSLDGWRASKKERSGGMLGLWIAAVQMQKSERDTTVRTGDEPVEVKKAA